MRQSAPTAPATLALVLLPVLACARSDEEWLRELADPRSDPFRRGLAAIAVAEQVPERGQDAVVPLLVLLDGPEGPLRPHAADAMRKIAPWSVDELLRPLLGSAYLSDDCREALEDALVSAGEAAVPALLGAMRDPSQANGRRFGLLLAEIGDPAVLALLSVAREDPSDAARMDAIWALGRCGEPARRALPTIVEALHGDDPGTAAAAAESLGRIDLEGGIALPLLRESIAKAGPGRHVAAAGGIARIHCARARSIDGEERTAAMREVLRLGSPVVAVLGEMVDDPDPLRSRFATEALLGIASTWSVLPTLRGRGPRTVPESTKDLASPSVDQRRNATLALARKGARAAPAIAPLLRAAGDESVGVRRGAALALALIAVDIGWRTGFGVAPRRAAGR